MLDHELCQSEAPRLSDAVLDAIESLRPPLTRPLRIEDCTTPELRLEYIAQWLESGAPHVGDVAGFDMSHVRREVDCGTVCCIAGATCTFFKKWYIFADGEWYGQNILGLETGMAYQLFVPTKVPMDKITPAWAARCIRKYQATGQVDWESTREP